MRLLFPLACLLLVSSPVAADDLQPAVAKIVEPFLKTKPYAGLTVGIITPAGTQTFGFGKIVIAGKEQTPDADTVYEIGSITKIFTGTLLAERVRLGKVKLDDPAQKYLPPTLVLPRRDDRDITLLHLATQTSSLPVQPPLIGAFALASEDPGNPYKTYGSENLKATLDGLKLTRAVGSEYEYSNLGVGILGHALSGSGDPAGYEKLLKAAILDPLGMKSTGLKLDAAMTARLAPGFGSTGAKASPWDFACLEACGGLRSNVRDMLSFANAAMGKDKTPLAEAFSLAQQSWRKLDGKADEIGLLWMRKRMADKKLMFWHNGGTGGYRSFLGVVPETGIGVVILSNTGGQSVDGLAIEILKAIDPPK